MQAILNQPVFNRALMKIYRPLLHTPSLGEKTLALAVEIYDLESVRPRHR